MTGDDKNMRYREGTSTWKSVCLSVWYPRDILLPLEMLFPTTSFVCNCMVRVAAVCQVLAAVLFLCGPF